MSGNSADITCAFVIIGGGISGVSCAEHLSLLCPKETIVLITATDVVKATCNLKKFGKTLEEFDVEERSASLVFKDSRNVVIVKSLVTAFDPEGRQTQSSIERYLYRNFINLSIPYCVGNLILYQTPGVVTR